MRPQRVLYIFFIVYTIESVAGITSIRNFQFDAKPDPLLQKFFQPQSNGWLGGDVASSTNLEQNKYLWIWGDTLVGSLKSGQRSIEAMPRNSLATLEVKNGVPTDVLKFHIRVNDTNLNGGFFTPDSVSHWYWPVNALMINEALYLMAYNVYATEGGPFGFAFQGTTVIRITNPTAAPEKWIWTSSDMSYSNEDLNWASGIVSDQKYVYLYGSSKTSDTALSRFTVDDFTQSKWTRQQFWAYDSNDQPTWRSFNATQDSSSLVKVLSPSISELSVTFHSYLNAWVTLNMEFGGTKILVSIADQLTGPWSEWLPIYDVPAPYNETQKVFCYALKRHPEFELAANELVLTFMSNTYSVDDLKTMLDVYVPQVVRVKINKNN